MFDLARILEAVTAVTEGRAATVTAKTPPLKGCTAVTAVTAQIGTNTTETSTNTKDSNPAPEPLSRVSIYDRNNRNNRTTSKDGGSAVTEGERPTVTTVTSTGTGTDTHGAKLVQLVRCGDCSKFMRNQDNPQAGIGTCKDGEPDRGRWPYYPLAVRVCEAFEDANHD